MDKNTSYTVVSKTLSVLQCKYSQATSITCCRGTASRFLLALVGWFIQWQTSDPHLISCLITLACGAQPGWMRRSWSCCQEQGAAKLPTLGGMEGPSFVTPTTVRWRKTLLFRVLQPFFLVLCRSIYLLI